MRVLDRIVLLMPEAEQEVPAIAVAEGRAETERCMRIRAEAPDFRRIGRSAAGRLTRRRGSTCRRSTDIQDDLIVDHGADLGIRADCRDSFCEFESRLIVTDKVLSGRDKLRAPNLNIELQGILRTKLAV